MNTKDIIKKYKNKDNLPFQTWESLLAIIEQNLTIKIGEKEQDIKEKFDIIVKKLTKDLEQWLIDTKENTNDAVLSYIETRKVEIKGEKGDSIVGPQGPKGESIMGPKGDRGDTAEIDYERAVRGVLAQLGDIREKSKDIVDKINNSSDKLLISSVKNLQEELDSIKKSIVTSIRPYLHGGGLTTVSHDTTLKGTGQSSSPLSTIKLLSTPSFTTSVTINVDSYNRFIITAQAGDLLFNNPSGTPTSGQTLWISVTGTATRNLSFDTQFEASTLDLPTTTVNTDRLDIGFVYISDTLKWRLVALC